jgi:hypothetical protein
MRHFQPSTPLAIGLLAGRVITPTIAALLIPATRGLNRRPPGGSRAAS